MAVDALVVVANYLGDFAITIHLRENPLADLRMSLHLAALVECQRTPLLEEAWLKPHFPDVVNQAANLNKLLLRGIKTHPFCDVAGIDRHSG